MDNAGVWASLCFPSLIAGFAGVAFSRSKDPELGLACVRAWNDWHCDVWAGTYPERIIPLQITWINDPFVAAAEVRRNAERGVQSPQLPREPVQPRAAVGAHRPLGPAARRLRGDGYGRLPPHRIGGVDRGPVTRGAVGAGDDLFPINGCAAAADWLWAKIPLRFPR